MMEQERKNIVSVQNDEMKTKSFLIPDLQHTIYSTLNSKASC